MERDYIVIQGARQHNLKNVSLTIPRDKLVVFTGLSGSGKSSLAFDTIYAEGQRRYVESLSAYARQFLGQMDKPDVDYIGGLSPAISIDQRPPARTLGPPWEQSRKSTTTCGSYLPGWDIPLPYAAVPLHPNRTADGRSAHDPAGGQRLQVLRGGAGQEGRVQEALR